MGLAIILPDEYGPKVASGETKITFQLQDSIEEGQTITIIAGDARREARIISKVWIPELEMQGKLRSRIQEIAPPRQEGFSGAFKIALDYSGTEEPSKMQEKPKESFGGDVDDIAKDLD
jgi:hypothetical protein